MHILKSRQNAHKEEEKIIIGNIYGMYIRARGSPKHLKEQLGGEIAQNAMCFACHGGSGKCGELTWEPYGDAQSQGEAWGDRFLPLTFIFASLLSLLHE